MLKEAPYTSQRPGEPERRWFCDDYFDLIVWHNKGDICGFQLCYDSRRNPRALTWARDGGYTHYGIDDGDDLHSGFKMTPVLVQDGAFDFAAVSRLFTEASAELPAEIRSLVLAKMQDYCISCRAPVSGGKPAG